MKTLGQFIQQFQGRNAKGGAKGPWDYLRIEKLWRFLVGDLLAENTRPLKLYKQNLTVVARHSVFSQEISVQKESLKQKIKLNLGLEVNKFFFQVNESVFEKIATKEKRTPRKIPTEAIETSPGLDLPWKQAPYSPKAKELKHYVRTNVPTLDDEDCQDLLDSIFLQHQISKKQ